MGDIKIKSRYSRSYYKFRSSEIVGVTKEALCVRLVLRSGSAVMLTYNKKTEREEIFKLFDNMPKYDSKTLECDFYSAHNVPKYMISDVTRNMDYELDGNRLVFFKGDRRRLYFLDTGKDYEKIEMVWPFLHENLDSQKYRLVKRMRAKYGERFREIPNKAAII